MNMLQNEIARVINTQYAGDRFIKLCRNRNPHTSTALPVVSRGHLHPSVESLAEAEQAWIRDHEKAVNTFGCAGSTRQYEDPAIAIVQLKVIVVGEVFNVDLQTLNKYINPL